MANLSDPEIFFNTGASEGQQESSLDREPITTKPLYSVEEIVNFAQIALYCLGFLSNLPILVIFFKQGFNSSLNIGFFSLALSDMSVCVVHGTDLTAKSFQRYFWGTHIFKDAGKELSAWITAVIFWERLCSMILPDRVGFNTLNINYIYSCPSVRSVQVYTRSNMCKVSLLQEFSYVKYSVNSRQHCPLSFHYNFCIVPRLIIEIIFF